MLEKSISIKEGTVDKKALENEYRRFLKIAEKWNTLVVENSVFHDINSTGEAFRHIALTHNVVVFEEAKACIAEWQRFANLCKQSKGAGSILNVLESVFMPIPFIIEDDSRTTQIIRQRVTTTRLMTREQLLKKYELIIRKSKKSSVFEPLREPLQKEKAFFDAQPIGELFRARKEGFTEAAIATTKPDSNTLDRYRVGTHGALIYAHKKNTIVPVIDYSNEKRSTTAYDGVSPIPCAPLGEFSLYRLRDLEYSQQTFLTKAHFLHSIESRNAKFQARIATLTANAKPGTQTLLKRKIQVARRALMQLEKMDMELIDIMLASGDNLTNLKLTDARKIYGNSIEEKYGCTFNKMMSVAKIR
jgi:hypothetical protein